MKQYAYISHSGVKGMRWGVRRYQNEDGTLTEEGKMRYGAIENYEAEVNRKKNLKRAAIIGAVAVAGIYVIAKSKAGKEVMNTGENAVKDVLKSNPKVTPEATKKGAESISKVANMSLANKSNPIDYRSISQKSINKMGDVSKFANINKPSIGKAIDDHNKYTKYANSTKSISAYANYLKTPAEGAKTVVQKTASAAKSTGSVSNYANMLGKGSTVAKTSADIVKNNGSASKQLAKATTSGKAFKEYVIKSKKGLKSAKKTFKDLDKLNAELLKKGAL